MQQNADGFRFGIEAEFMLADAETLRPLWHRDLTFAALNEVLEAIPVDDLPPLAGLELEPPHRKLMPYVVEGYHVPAPDLSPIDILPKGVEVRTPVCGSIDECLACFQALYGRLQTALQRCGYQLISLSHHPTEHGFEGPQNKRRYDYWQWAMEVMTTYGPDINVSLPRGLQHRIDVADLHRKVNYYAPALAALSLASPIYRGRLWRIRERLGKSIRTYRRSIIAPAIELHPQEAGRMEFKLFEASNRLEDYRAYLLLWLALLLDDGLKGRARDQSRIYDLGAIARFGLEAETARPRAEAVLDRAPAVLGRHGFDAAALAGFRRRLETGRLPADDIIDEFEGSKSIAAVLRTRGGLLPESEGDRQGPLRDGAVGLGAQLRSTGGGH